MNKSTTLTAASEMVAAGKSIRISRSGFDRAARRLEKTLMERGLAVLFVTPFTSGAEVADEIARLLRLGVDAEDVVAVIEDPSRTEMAVFDALSQARAPFAGVVDEILVAPW
jgi:hypothetical protein